MPAAALLLNAPLPSRIAKEHVGARVAVGDLTTLADLDEALSLVAVVGEVGAHAGHRFSIDQIATEQIAAIAVFLIGELYQLIETLAHFDGNHFPGFVAL